MPVMKRNPSIILRCLFTFMAVATSLYGQDAKTHTPRISLRLNTLGVFNLDATGDVEFAINNRIGVFAGGGSEYIKSYIPPSRKFSKMSQDICKRNNWGIYAGIHLSLPIGKATGFGVRPLIYFQNLHTEGLGCYGTLPTNSTLESVFQMHELALMLNAVYTQTFAKRFFVEPLLGFGPLASQEIKAGTAQKARLGISGFWQLNLGVRF
jgi:hypothetical protein